MSSVAAGEIADRPGRHGPRFLGYLRDRLAASDPAYSRLRLASRALLAVILSAAILAAITYAIGPLPFGAYGMAVVLAFVGSMAVRDPTLKGQVVTRGYGLGISLASVFVAGLLAGTPIIADLVFLAVIFAAVYIRKFGMRWFGIGMMAFMAYFMGDYLKPMPGDIGWIAAASFIALAMTHIVNNYILRDDRERDFRRAMVTIDRRINLILRDLLQEAEKGATSAIADRPDQQTHLDQLRDIVLMAEGFISQGEDGSLAVEGPASELATALFELQLAVERMVRASYLELPPRELLRAVLYDNDKAVQAELTRLRDSAPGGDVPARLLVRVQRALARIEAATIPAAFAPLPQRPAGAPATSAAAASTGLIPVSLHLPIQVTLACALALGGGLLLSPVRWYWAVITAFIVFNNTRSRADTALRALQRSAGTFAGLIVGTAAATLLQGQFAVSAVAIPVLFFFAFYFLQTSYSTMIFLITIALALLYGLMGMFTPELLLLRLEETVVGSLAGVAVAFLVFPTRASTGAATALDKYLTALGDIVAAARRRAHGEKGAGNLLALSRTLDRAYTDLANAVRPLGGAWDAVTRFGQVREKLLLLTGCAHWARAMARSLTSGALPEGEMLARLDVLAAEVTDRIATARALEGTYFERPRKRGDVEELIAPRPPLPITEDENAVFSLEVISALLDRATGHAPEKPAASG
ncbi:MAG TPA: FUSC family protein [Devosiaceae bacterium]|jgi:uncharacterized membrane protein YccC